MGQVPPACCGEPAGPGAPSFALMAEPPSGLAYDFVLTLGSEVSTSGCYCMRADATDLAGNVGTRDVSSLGLDLSPPAPLDVTVPKRVRYLRVPYGSADSVARAPSFAVVGEGVEPGSRVAIFSAVDPAAALLLGHGVADASGAFVASLEAVDRPFVYGQILDAAGNTSANVRVEDGRWTVTLAGKQRGSVFENPHTLRVGNALPVAPSSGHLVEPLQSDIDHAAQRFGDAPLWVSEQFVWQEGALGTGPRSAMGTAAAFDSARGRSVLFGGWMFFSSDDTWTYSVETGFAQAAQGVLRPPGLFGAAMVYDRERDHTVLFGGGKDSGVAQLDFIASNETWQWDELGWTLAAPGLPVPPARLLHSMAYIPESGEVLLFGGCSNFDCPSGALGDTWSFDGKDWHELLPVHSPPARLFHAMAYDPASGAVLLFGGCAANTLAGGCTAVLGDTWQWQNGDWQELHPTTTPTARVAHGLAYSANAGGVVLAGGTGAGASCEGAAGAVCPHLWVWHDGDWWQQGAATDRPGRWLFAMVGDSNQGDVLLFGGSEDDGTGSSHGVVGPLRWTGTSWRNEEQTGLVMAHARSGMAYSAKLNEIVRVDGGGQFILASPSYYLNNSWRRSAGGWRLDEARMTFERYAPELVYDANRGAVLLFGGGNSAGTVFYTDAWWFDGAAWTPMVVSPTPPPPPARGAPTFAFDAARDCFVLFGGAKSITYGDTWELCYSVAGSNWVWSQRCDGALCDGVAAAQPSPRSASAMAYDSTRHRIVLYGGMDLSGACMNTVPTPKLACDDTWEWDGTTWLKATPATRPEARYWHRLAYDSKRGRVLLFGGGSEGLSPYRGTYEWDGVTWKLLPTTGMGIAPNEPGLAFDAERGRLVAFGGTRGGGTLYDSTWELDLNPTVRPAATLDVDWRASGIAVSAITGIEVAANVGGRGYTTDLDYTDSQLLGTAVDGVELLAWDWVSGAWVSLVTALDGSPIAPTPLSYASTAAASVQRLARGPTSSLLLALRPRQGSGNGPAPGELALDYLEVTLTYR